jgi:Ca2+-binding RTX toxin-like protein
VIRRTTAILAVLAVAIAPASALGAVASVRTDEFGDTILFYEAGAGEANDLAMSEGLPRRTVTLRDEGATVVAGAGCVQVDPNEVRCGTVAATSVELGDLGDIFTMVNGNVGVDGGSGADQLTICPLCVGSLHGGGGDDVLIAGGDFGHFLTGGPGADTLTSGSGEDWVEGGPGSDTIWTGAGVDVVFPGGGDDSVDAGPDEDRLLYYDARAPVTVDLLAGTATGAGTDTVIGFEGVEGSPFGDRLYGDARLNELFGLGGNDLLVGRGGADFLHGGAVFRPATEGRDRLFGGPGRDQLEGLNGDDLLVGGPGSDQLRAGAGNDFISARDGELDLVRGQEGFDRARVDIDLDNVAGVELFVCPRGCR